MIYITTLIQTAESVLNKHLLILIMIALLFFGSCNLLNSDESIEPAEVPEYLKLYSTVFGQGRGLWTFTADSLVAIDTLSTEEVWGIQFSSDYQIYYGGWWDNESGSHNVYAFDMNTQEILMEREVWNSVVTIDHKNEQLIGMGANDGIQVIDLKDFGLVFEGYTQFRNNALKAAISPTKNEYYTLVNKKGISGVSGLVVFNTNTTKIETVIPLTDDDIRKRTMQGSFLDVSPDGRYVYATVFNWQSGGGYGSFHVFDMEKREQVFEADCGSFAWIGVSPNGRYVYLSDSAGTPYNTIGISYEFTPSNTILRYDVQRRQIDIFADGGSTFGLSDTENDVLITSSIAVLPDSRSMYIRVLAGGQTIDSLSPSIMHVDTRTKEILNVFTPEPDPDGFIRSSFHHLQIGRRSR